MQNKSYLSNHLITNEKWETINKVMKDPKFSECCFLDPAEDARAVIAKDAEYLVSVGITNEQIADKMESILDKAGYVTMFNRKYLINEEYIQIDGLYVEYLGTMGTQVCPFGCDYGTGVDIYIHKNLPTKKCEHNKHHYKSTENSRCDLWFGGLLVHMIRYHEFFEGNCHFRV
jgi:hypothetical protein